MIHITEKSMCCGCGACAQICVSGCISMKPDEEGFLYPHVNGADCVQCGLCEHSCPILRAVPEKERPQKAYLVQHRNEQIRMESTSGGAFTAIAQSILAEGGVVFGAAFDDRFHVRHVCIESSDTLFLLRGSKYVQSEIGNTFAQAREHLDKGKWVCFSGTPCQIEGLLSFLGKAYERLITVDVVCRAVPSPLVWEKYVGLQAKTGRIQKIKFRDKESYGYDYSQLSLQYKDGTVIKQGIDSDPFLRAFFSNICSRPSCYTCRFKKRFRESDITMWDCFTIGQYEKQMDDDQGTTRVLTHSKQGEACLENALMNLRYAKRSPDDICKDVREMYRSIEQNPLRAAFLTDAGKIDAESLFDKYFARKRRQRMERSIRILLSRLHIGQRVKRRIKAITQRG